MVVVVVVIFYCFSSLFAIGFRVVGPVAILAQARVIINHVAEMSWEKKTAADRREQYNKSCKEANAQNIKVGPQQNHEVRPEQNNTVAVAATATLSSDGNSDIVDYSHSRVKKSAKSHASRMIDKERRLRWRRRQLQHRRRSRQRLRRRWQRRRRRQQSRVPHVRVGQS